MFKYDKVLLYPTPRMTIGITAFCICYCIYVRVACPITNSFVRENPLSRYYLIAGQGREKSVHAFQRVVIDGEHKH